MNNHGNFPSQAHSSSLRSRGVVALVVTTALFIAAPGCSAAPDAAPEDLGATESEALTRTTAVSRAMEWANVKLHYCQSANHARDYDSACSTYCSRHDNAKWNPYRSDCSGLISWAWKLAAPGRTTYQFSPFENDITHVIHASSLEPGDAVNNAEHVMLFKEWIVKDREARFIEEPGCSSATPYAHELTSHVSINGTSIYVDYNGMSFHAIRYNRL